MLCSYVLDMYHHKHVCTLLRSTYMYYEGITQQLGSVLATEYMSM